MSAERRWESMMTKHLYWLSDAEWEALQPHFRTGRRLI